MITLTQLVENATKQNAIIEYHTMIHGNKYDCIEVPSIAIKFNNNRTEVYYWFAILPFAETCLFMHSYKSASGKMVKKITSNNNNNYNVLRKLNYFGQ